MSFDTAVSSLVGLLVMAVVALAAKRSRPVLTGEDAEAEDAEDEEAEAALSALSGVLFGAAPILQLIIWNFCVLLFLSFLQNHRFFAPALS